MEAERAARAIGPLTLLAGVGPARAARLERLGLRSVRDLLLLLPRELEEWEAPVSIAALEPDAGRLQRIRARVVRAHLRRGPGRGRSVLRAVCTDASGEIDVVFFNQAWLAERLVAGTAVDVRGRWNDSVRPALVASRLGGEERPLPEPGALVPVYPLVDGISQELLRRLCRTAAEEHADALAEPLPAEALAARGLPPLAAAVRELHRPSGRDAWEAARARASLEPILTLQARLEARRAAASSGSAPVLAAEPEQKRALRARFPFELTADQRAACDAVERDVARSVPMRRLLQGDVGSGKTAVGIHACMLAAACGAQAAFMAPTELLAEQHALGLAGLLQRAGLASVLLTGSLPAAERRRREADLASGRIDVAIGTHALFSEGVRFARLGLAVIDEQHRFGVSQRQRLLEKGRDVHALFMTATPIPRSLAMTLYGDLEVTTIRTLPPGRGRLRTRWVRGPARRKIPRFLRERLAAGERVYWVCPRIEGQPGSGPASAEARYENLVRTPLSETGIELVHGRLEPGERAARLARFTSGVAGLVVATTVIEVGVDVPEATVMVVESAERLGLAQLHQLRGRVGRGPRDSWCLLLGRAAAAERLELLTRTSDGFEIAEADLVQRGMGDLLGLRQAGPNAEGLADPETGLALLKLARELVSSDPDLAAGYLADGEEAFLA